MLDQSGRPTPGPSQKEGSKIGGTVFDSMYNKHHAHRGTAPVLTDLSTLHPHARIKSFFSKKMPLCHLPCVYGGSRGGIMVALVAFSGGFSRSGEPTVAGRRVKQFVIRQN